MLKRVRRWFDIACLIGTALKNGRKVYVEDPKHGVLSRVYLH